MFGSRLLDTSPSRRRTLSSLLELSGRYAAPPAHLRYMDSAGASDAGHGNYVSLAELAAQPINAPCGPERSSEQSAAITADMIARSRPATAQCA